MKNIKEKLLHLPTQPGVYLMQDKTDKIIYVGKALNLKNRIKSYFTGNHHDNKTKHLVANIDDFEYIITNSEQEAFILEANLIKQHQPKYNIILKDDKRYPFIKIALNDDFPTIEITRDVVKDGSVYYGPYTDSRLLRTMLRDLEWIFPHKTCSKNITINTQNQRACLNFQLGKCPAPCIGNISKTEYAKLINKIGKYLLGKDNDLISELKHEMENHADLLEFEKAAKIRDKINYLDVLTKKQHVYFNDLQDRDIIAYYKEDKHIAVTILKIKNGKMNQKETFGFDNSTDETPEAVLRAFLLQYYQITIEENKLPYQILIQIQPDDLDSLNILFKKKIVIPARGEYKHLIEICRKNAFDYIEAKKLSHLKKANRTIIPIQELKEHLKLRILPRKMVCVDISNIQGSDNVSAIVFFENGKPMKKHYRRFIIKSVIGQNDFASIAETLDRYLNNIKNDKTWEKPDLIIVDGGKGQLSSAVEILNKHLEDNLNDIEIISLAKRIEEIFLPGKSESIILPKTCSALRVLTQIRDEAHRFAIEFHRKRRNKNMINSKLDDIKGLSEDLKFLLLKEFGSVENIQNADIESLMKIKGIGEKLAKRITALSP